MNKNATGFVRRDMVKPAEPRRIGPAVQGVSAGRPASARLVSQEETTALVEVVCSCGQRIHLNCEYESDKPSG